MYKIIIYDDLNKKAIKETTVNNYKELKELRKTLAYGLYAYVINNELPTCDYNTRRR